LPTEGEPLAGAFLAHRRVTEEVVARLPASAADLRPWPGAMSALELVRHMLFAHHRFVELACGRPAPNPDPEAAPTLQEARELLRTTTEYDAQVIRQLSAEQLQTTVRFRERTIPARQLLDLAREHEIHHKGQLFVYARMAGVSELPHWRMLQ